ncbi:MAG TPA: ATP-binding cassette domain-containing protein [Puia sp.]|jgi:polar amino acid transport system ATP-binding protein/sulfate transport system ATP-binding protein/NitT/TauT family transport system ATP-binding protein
MTAYTKEEVLLRARDLSLTYGDKCILHDINFCIRDIIRPGLKQGQVVSLIGRSGIGKTQLFRILSGLQKPSSGSITIRERKVQENSNGSIDMYHERKVAPGDMGVIFQNYYQFGWRTVQQSLMLAARQNKRLAGREEDTIRQYAGQFELSDVLHRYPSQLSGGQQQRVSIIQQLLKGSDFLLLDEPFSGLDVCVLDKVVELLLQVSLSDELQTLIIVSHDIATAVAISDTVFILGKQEGSAGSTLVREIDLIERDLAWKKDVRGEKIFEETIREIKECL